MKLTASTQSSAEIIVVDMFTKAKRSSIMSGIRSNGNYSTERRLIAIMRRFRITGWRRGIKLPGKPDFVFRKARVVVFVDGDFWHGNPRGFRLPKSNVEYWQKKIEGNRARDKEHTRTLKRLGWRVIRIWESALGDEEAIAARISLATRSMATSVPPPSRTSKLHVPRTRSLPHEPARPIVRRRMTKSR